MNRRVFLAALLAAVVALLPVWYLHLIWHRVLAFVPIHYNAGGVPNHFVGKEWLWNIAWFPSIAFAVLTFFPQVQVGQSIFWSSSRQRWTRLVVVAALALAIAALIRSSANASQDHQFLPHRLRAPTQATGR
ncbi:hypothetical protein GO988_00230 [Hymenobacter sp. HMF4947]|uniref:DUF1648 domain-containing protein n=1 Tax=Hymenobacter ginkgonis TaxID=2682976 RepID=A0A7K1T8L5_9BACT|nr:hypothetical protein [Hymenobacter ginkgonis]MVN74747.1 hypothetical protein [Hymenobacter ginkgonis]